MILYNAHQVFKKQNKVEEEFIWQQTHQVETVIVMEQLKADHKPKHHQVTMLSGTLKQVGL